MKLNFHEDLSNSIEIKKLESYIAHCKQVVETKDYLSLEASLCVPSDEIIMKEARQMCEKKKTKELKYNIVIGIGGSNLGTKAIYDALFGSVDNLQPERNPKMYFLDSIDPKATQALVDFIHKHATKSDEFIISIISKSGTNTEPLVNAEILLGTLKTKFSNWKERCVIITDENSKLWNEGKSMGIDVLSIPKQVGGRYSVFTAVGLFPLIMNGINIDLVLKGAQEMREECLSLKDNNAANSSIFHYLNMLKGKSIHNSFYFHPELESLGKWYRQLVGESIGKEGKGITPMVSIGSVDHHSMVQLYWGGPSDKTTEIVYAKKSESCSVPQDLVFPSLSKTQGKNTSEIVSAIRQGTVIAYQKQNQPYFEVIFEEINEYELGAYMQYKMMEIMYLAHLMEIKAFDQPQVELYKIETRKILERK